MPLNVYQCLVVQYSHRLAVQSPFEVTNATFEISGYGEFPSASDILALDRYGLENFIRFVDELPDFGKEFLLVVERATYGEQLRKRIEGVLGIDGSLNKINVPPISQNIVGILEQLKSGNPYACSPPTPVNRLDGVVDRLYQHKMHVTGPWCWSYR